MEINVTQMENTLKVFLWVMGALDAIIVLQVVVLQVGWKSIKKGRRMKISKEMDYKLSGDVDRMLKKK